MTGTQTETHSDALVFFGLIGTMLKVFKLPWQRNSV